jgi:uncharacterized protein YgbK (DUF1537 family)
MILNYQNTIDALPLIPATDLKPTIQAELVASNKVIIVLDDDPTGTQTIHNIPVLTVWDENSIAAEIERGTKILFILTNSRSMTVDLADALNTEIGESIDQVFKKLDKEYIIISRSDSTLRGHYPNELLALTNALYIKKHITAVIPAFFEGGRFTINDIHYVKEDTELIPASETPFAKDKAFGFAQSNLKNWIEEKTKGNVKASDVISFSLEKLRNDTLESVIEELKLVPKAATIIVNATDYYDLEKFALAYFQSGVNIVFRTAASFVKAIAGISNRALLEKHELVSENNPNGGLIVVGSYVSKTTKQLTNLLKIEQIKAIELDINAILNHNLKIENVIIQIESFIAKGKNVVLYTSRDLRSGPDEKESLKIGNTIADFVTSTVEKLSIAPKFIIAKGGITSSDIATKALHIKRAMVLGQALPGVPVWQAGAESKFPFMPYIIFPGNVGDDEALANLYHKIA